MPRIDAGCKGNRKTENCTAVLFCFTTVSLPAFAGDVLRQIVVRASLNVDGIKSKSSPQNSGKPGRTCHTVPAKFYPSPVVFLTGFGLRGIAWHVCLPLSGVKPMQGVTRVGSGACTPSCAVRPISLSLPPCMNPHSCGLI